jgi:hypothetical protein
VRVAFLTTLAAAFVVAAMLGTARGQEEPQSYEYYEPYYEFVPVEPPPPEPIPEWVGPATLAVLAGFVVLLVILIVLSNRGNVAVQRSGRDHVHGVELIDIDRLVRVRESLRVVRTYFGTSLLSVGSFFYAAFLLGAIAFAVFAMAGTVPAQSLPISLLVLLGVNVVALIALFFTSLFQYIHRRLVSAFQVIMTPFVILINIIGIGMAGSSFAAGVESLLGTHSETLPGIVTIVLMSLIIASVVMVFGWARNCWRVMMARRDNFLVARGWRSPRYTLGGAVRRMLGVPTYVSALRTGRRRVMALFVLGGALGAGAALFPLAAPGLIANFLAIGVDPDGYIDESMARGAVIFTPVAVVLFYLFFRFLAFLGRLASRAGQRMAANRYQSVREWDARAPILFLRSFAIDNAPVATKPRGWTARLIGLGARFPTLDEAVLDCAAPYGPVIAIGDPRDPVPPLGAARTFVGGGDWKQVVGDLARASQLIVLAIDSSEGVRWEVDHVINQGHAGKTLFIGSPERTPQERAAALSEVARALGHGASLPDNAIALSSAPQGVEVLCAPNVSGDSYAAAINLRLQQDFGLDVNFPRRPRGGTTTAYAPSPKASQPAGSTAGALVGVIAAAALIIGAGYLLWPLGQQFANRDVGAFSGNVSCALDYNTSYWTDMTAEDINFTASGRLCINGRTLYERTGDRYQRVILSSTASAVDILLIDPATGQFTRERYPLSEEALAMALQTPGDTGSGLACEDPYAASLVRERNASLMRFAQGEPTQRLRWRCQRY